MGINIETEKIESSPPPGFVLDKTLTSMSSLPEGFVLDTNQLPDIGLAPSHGPEPSPYPIDHDLNEWYKKRSADEEPPHENVVDLIWDFSRPFVNMGWSGVSAFNRGMGRFMTNLDTIFQYSEKKRVEAGGEAIPQEKGFHLFKKLADNYNSNADQFQKMAIENRTDFLNKFLGEFLGSLVPGALEFTVALKSLLTYPIILGYAEAEKEGKSDIQKSLNAIGKAAEVGILGWIFGSLHNYSVYSKAPILGTTFAVEDATKQLLTTGEINPNQVIEAGATGTGLALTTPGGRMGFKEFRDNLTREYPKIIEDLKLKEKEGPTVAERGVEPPKGEPVKTVEELILGELPIKPTLPKQEPTELDKKIVEQEVKVEALTPKGESTWEKLSGLEKPQEISLKEFFKTGRKEITETEVINLPDVKSGSKSVDEMKEYLEGKGITVKKQNPELSPTAKDQFALPGIKQGLEMKGAKEVNPTLEGTPLMEAANKAQVEEVQGKIFGEKPKKKITEVGGFFGEPGTPDILDWVRGKGGINSESISGDFKSISQKEGGFRGKSAVIKKGGKGLDILRDEAEWEGRISPGTDINNFYSMIEDAVSAGPERKKYQFKTEKELYDFFDKVAQEEFRKEVRAGEQKGAFIIGKPEVPIQKFIFEDPKIENNYEKSIPQKETFAQNVKAFLSDIWHKMTRTYENLPRTKEFAQLQFDLKKLEKQKGVQSYNAIMDLGRVLVRVKQPEVVDLYARKIVLDDLSREADLGHALPWGFTPETVARELARVDAEIPKYPEVQGALGKRKIMWDTLKSDYISAMKDIGLDVEERLNNDKYFRHQVLEYINLKGIFGAGKRLKVPAGRGFLKERKGSELDINRDFLQPDYEVATQMLYDIQVAKVLRSVDENYNISGKLKQTAKDKNFEKLVGGPQIVKRIRSLERELEEIRTNAQEEGGMDSADKQRAKDIADELRELDPTRPFKQKMAIGFSKLEKMGIEVDDLKILSELSKEEGPAGMAALTVLGAIQEREAFIKGTLQKDYLEWKYGIDDRLVPETHGKWQPREGNVFYMVDSIPAKLAEKIMKSGLEEISKEDLSKTLAIGRDRKEFVLKQEVIDTLNNLTKTKEAGIFADADKALMKSWKVWQLISPRRLLKYNIRNLTGDADAAFVGNPRGFLKTPQAVKELMGIFSGKKEITGELKEYFDRGGFQSTLQTQEMGELKDLWVFERLYTKENNIKDVPYRVWQKYWKSARISTDLREQVLRYANYVDYLEQMKKNADGRPNNFGASKPEEIMGLSDIRDRAYWLSNDLLGAYDRVSVMGNFLRSYLWPFWSWKEINFKRYMQFAKNATSDGDFAQLVGRAAVGTLAQTPFMAARVGKFLVSATAFWATLQVWNNTMFPEEEKKLSEEEQSRPHIILGKDQDGNIINFNRVGALGDYLEWFGLDSAPNNISQWFRGERTLKEIAIDMVKSPINVMVQQVTPYIKVPVEMITGRSLFPDFSKPGTIKDEWLYLARHLGLENEYKAIAGLPSRGYEKSLSNLLVYSSEPGQGAYADIQDAKQRWLKKEGKGAEGFWITPKGQALYNLKLAIRYQDQTALEKYMAEYFMLGGTPKGMIESEMRMEPLSGLNAMDRRKFISSLTENQVKRLEKAEEFYWNVLRAGKKQGGQK